MSIYFLDTSAIVKRYFKEKGHTWIKQLCEPGQGHELYISQVALVEVVATVCRKTRESNGTPFPISLSDRDRLIQIFEEDSKNAYNVWRVTDREYKVAADLCCSHKLRAYDAIQLACAITVRNDLLMRKAFDTIFVCADKDLLKAAVERYADWPVENPEDHVDRLDISP